MSVPRRLALRRSALRCAALRCAALWCLLCFPRALRVAGYDLDAVGVDRVRVVELEVDVFDDEGPYVIAEAVCIQMALEAHHVSTKS